MTNAQPAANLDQARIPTFTISEKLRKAREHANITREQMSAELGVSVRSIVRYENGGNVAKSTVLLYAVRTNVPAEWIDPVRCTPRDLNPEPTDSGTAAVPVLAEVVELRPSAEHIERKTA